MCSNLIKLSLIIPVFNEKEAISDFIFNTKNIMSKSNIGCEYIFIDDCSTDGTSKILVKEEVTVLTHSKNLGYGASIKHGIKSAKGRIICTIDADNTYSLSDIQRLLPFSEKYDMVVGARKLGPYTFPFYQRIVKCLICFILTKIFRQNILDINSGLRLIKKDVIVKYLSVLPGGFSFTDSLTLVMLLDNYKIKYVDINYYKRRGNSKVRLFNYTIDFIKSYWKIIYFHIYKRKVQ